MGEAAEAALREARRWIGTPFLHRASRRGAGCDCLGLIRGVWRAVYGREPAATPAYAPGRRPRRESDAMRRAAEAAGRPVAAAEARPGDILLIGLARRGVPDHLALRGEDPQGRPTLIHAWAGRAVAEQALGPALARRVVTAIRLPERSG
jgi:putative phage cell wall peptidase, NlpC/P60 family